MKQETIEVLPASTPLGGWRPVVGSETTELLNRKFPDDRAAREMVKASAYKILSQCVNPQDSGRRHTGLVVGHVQSGKTLSFTTVAALANDNDFPIVVVIAGMTIELAEQSKDRLLHDLGVDRSPFTRWRHYHNPSRAEAAYIRDQLEEWTDPDVPREERHTLLLTVLKNHGRLRDLANVLGSIGYLADLPALIIDDEADQASLNSLVNQGELSATYVRINEVRNALRHHSFLQYTATPQANLLINLIDALSPESVSVLEPGENYVGGSDIVFPNSPYARVIPTSDIPDRQHPFDEPPDSLLEAMRHFFVGVASGLHRRDERPPNRSMMVHPSRLVASHHQYFRWIEQIRRLWTECLSGSIGEDDKDALLDEFRRAHADLQQTVDDLEAFETLEPRLLSAVRRAQVRELNSDSQLREIRWTNGYAWILVGGQVLDRGFTVEGLTVTYMPRGRGIGNADTIQQRARFLGYRRGYLGFCRLYLEIDVLQAYQAYVRHEEDMRHRLRSFESTRRPLREFRRMFVLDPSLRPTRRSVLDIEPVRPSFRHGWFTPTRPPLGAPMLDTNRQVVTSFLQKHTALLREDDGHPDRTPMQRHAVLDQVGLQSIYDDLLALFEMDNIEDDRNWVFALLLIDRHLERAPDARCTVFHMSRGDDRRRQLRDGEIVNLFQGPHPDASGSVYPGDRRIRGSHDVGVQIHNVTFRDGTGRDASVVAESVPILTVWMSNAVATDDIIIQEQDS